MTEIQFQFVKAEDTWPLRHKVLRPHQTLKDCTFPQDSWPSTFHVAALENSVIIGIATFHEEVLAELKSARPYRLRGMATDFSKHRNGIGRQVLEKGMEELKLRNCDLLWCNAREIAFPFYEKLGLSYLGPMFDIPGLGPHKVMYKHLR